MINLATLANPQQSRHRKLAVATPTPRIGFHSARRDRRRETPNAPVVKVWGVTTTWMQMIMTKWARMMNGGLSMIWVRGREVRRTDPIGSMTPVRATHITR
jgi:hypothetical protein